MSDDEYFEEETRESSETHYPYFKELEPVFWKRQEEILKQLEALEVEREQKKTISLPSQWTDFPPIITKDSLLYSLYSEMLENPRAYNKASVTGTSGSYLESVINAKVSMSKEEAEKILGIEVPEEMRELEEFVFTISNAYKIWIVVQPTHLTPLPSGLWSSDRWVPEIKKGNQWIAASILQCRNWSKIPSDRKRVRFCLGAIPEIGAVLKGDLLEGLTGLDSFKL